MREDITSPQLAAYLNQLLGRAHNLIYMGQRPKISGIVKFYSETYPQIFRETLPETLDVYKRQLGSKKATAGWS